MPYLNASAVVIHYEEALYQVYAPLPLPFTAATLTTEHVPLPQMCYHSRGELVRAFVIHRTGGEHKYHAIKQRKNTLNQDNQTLFILGFMEMIPSGVFLANRLSSNDNLTRTT